MVARPFQWLVGLLPDRQHREASDPLTIRSFYADKNFFLSCSMSVPTQSGVQLKHPNLKSLGSHSQQLLLRLL
jgi:hypothetical protein